MDDDMDDSIEVAHIFTPDGCKISLNGQGHLPCEAHDKEFVLKFLEDSLASDTDADPRA